MRRVLRWDFFYQLMACPDHLLIDPIEDLGREQAQVVLERLQLVLRLVGPVAVAQHLTQGGVLVRQLLDTVVVGVQTEPQNPENQNPPLLHSRAARVRIGFALAVHTLRPDIPQDREDTLTQLGLGIDVLQPAKKLGNVVARFGVQIDRADVDAVQKHLWIDDLAHVLFATRSFEPNAHDVRSGAGCQPGCHLGDHAAADDRGDEVRSSIIQIFDRRNSQATGLRP